MDQTREFEPLEMPGGKRMTGYVPREDRRILPEIAVEAICRTQLRRFIEIGSWAGTSAKMLSDATAASIYCVDTWEGSRGDITGPMAAQLGPRTLFQNFCRNMGDDLFRTVFPLVGRSRTYAEIWPFKVAGVFIDASHEYADAAEDIRLWAPHVAEGGVLCGHDYCLFPDVKRAVDEFAATVDVPLRVDEEVWYFAPWKAKAATAELAPVIQVQ